jgi:hypothetical protein
MLKLSHSICPLNFDMKAKLPASWGNMWQEFNYLNLTESFLSDEELPVPPSWFEVPLEGDLKGMALLLSITRRPWTHAFLRI